MLTADKEFLEERLLLCLLRSDWQNVDGILKKSVPDFENFQKLLKNSGAGSYIDWVVEKEDKRSLFPDQYTNLFQSARKRAKIDNSYILGILDKVLDATAKTKIEVILLKGADLIHRTYKSPELRHLDDIDLLIHKEDLGQFLDLLQTLDFKVPSGRELEYFKRSSYNVECWTKSLFPCLFEVHWDLSQKFRYRINMDDLWKNAEIAPSLSQQVKLLKPEHLFIHLCLHIFHHSFHPQLKWHIDIKELLQQRASEIDMGSISTISAEWGCRHAVFYALLYLKKLFPELIQRSFFAHFQPSAMRDHLISICYSENPVRLFDSGGKKSSERMVRTLCIDRVSDMILFSFNRMIRNPWVKFPREAED